MDCTEVLLSRSMISKQCMQVFVVPEGLWILLSVLLQSRDQQVPESEIQRAADKACADAGPYPDSLKRLQKLLAQHDLAGNAAQ